MRAPWAEYRDGRVRYVCPCGWKGHWTTDTGLAYDRAVDHQHKGVIDE